jgi:putative transposase
MSGRAVAEALDRAIAKHGKPQTITVDHGTEFTSRVLDEWAYQRGVLLDFIRPGKPVEYGSPPLMCSRRAIHKDFRPARGFCRT